MVRKEKLCPHYGKFHTEETKRKQSESGKNKPPMTEKTRQKMSESKTKWDKILTEEF